MALSPHPRPATLGQLRESGWVSRSVKDELRANAITKIRAGEQLFPRVLGYEETVLPKLARGTKPLRSPRSG